MAASETFIVQGEDPPTAAGPVAVASEPVAASPRWPQLIPIAQLVAVVLGVLAIIWKQQQTTDSVRSELRTEIAGVRAEMGELRAEVSENGQRLARIEGFLGIGIPDSSPE
ncbi:MAG: hypothetical protein F4110_03155 [Acidimicrobiaceae bacterium]|nr:hypothetical protein [Acidimicrobiaceae bacterium]MXZ99025.1 hypothetical protein [Acidimicrobiaceae bacterium]MYE75402.1 hypothetical protein [Acidimicrobiaceae bacterium]MYE96210.1 hypothetical protein [Acidimicrobiaceae bacterium]MYH43583.1 hypothetical protein [Acidimicrobiaceae bacterium]